jgi:hypothetical protein
MLLERRQFKLANFRHYMTMFFWVVTPCTLAGRYQHTVSIFRAKDVCFYETFISTYESTTRRQNPEEQHRHPHRRENPKSLVVTPL